MTISRGTGQKMRRFSPRLIEDLAAHGGRGVESDLGDYAARWRRYGAAPASAPAVTVGTLLVLFGKASTTAHMGAAHRAPPELDD